MLQRALPVAVLVTLASVAGCLSSKDIEDWNKYADAANPILNDTGDALAKVEAASEAYTENASSLEEVAQVVKGQRERMEGLKAKLAGLVPPESAKEVHAALQAYLNATLVAVDDLDQCLNQNAQAKCEAFEADSAKAMRARDAYNAKVDEANRRMSG